MTLRLVKEHELKQAAMLAEDVFCKEGNRYMESSFPTLFRPGVSHSYGAFDENGKLVAFMGMVPVIIQSGDAHLFAFSIGAVCTHPNSRGQGLAGKLLTLCKQHAKNAGASLMFISGDRSLYTRAGSVFFGKSTKFVIHADMKDKLSEQEDTPQWNLRDMEPTDIFAVHALLNRQSAAIQWGIADLQQMLGAHSIANIQHQNQYIQVAESSNKEIHAFVVLAIPMSDHPSKERVGTVVEWAGTPSAITTLLSHTILQFNLSSLTLIVPWHHTEFVDYLEHAGVTSSTPETNAGTVLILDGANLISQAGLATADPTHDQDATISVLPDGSYVLNTIDGTSKVASNAELCSLLFDPDSTINQPGDAKLATLPLPYMYGLYYI